MRPEISKIHAAARRERALEMNRLVLAPIPARLRRLAKPEPRKVAAVFPTVRGC